MARQLCIYLVLSVCWAVASSGPVLADEAYVCEGGRLAFVKSEELPQMKLSDPCIAGYFGLLPMPPPGFKPEISGLERAPPEKDRADVKVTRTGAALLPAPVLKRLKDGEPRLDAPRPLTASLTVPDPMTGFRNIRVLNAAPGADAWFHHAK